MTESLGFRVHYTRVTHHFQTVTPHPAAHLAPRTSFRGSNATEESPEWFVQAAMTYSQNLLSFSRSAALVSDANPAKRIASEKEEQGSERSFRREA